MADFEDKKQDNKKENNINESGNDKSQNQQENITDKIGSAVTGDSGAAKDVYNQAKDSVGKVYGIASEKAASKIDEQKTNLAQGISSVAGTIRQLGDNLQTPETPNSVADAASKYSNSVADKVEQLSDYFEKKDLREVLRDLEDFAHRQPAIFLGGAFALGILAARFLKSSSQSGGGQNRGAKRLNGKKGGKGIDSEGLHLPENLDAQVKANKEGVHLPEDLDDQIKSKNQTGSGGNQSAGAAK